MMHGPVELHLGPSGWWMRQGSTSRRLLAATQAAAAIEAARRVGGYVHLCDGELPARREKPLVRRELQTNIVIAPELVADDGAPGDDYMAREAKRRIRRPSPIGEMLLKGHTLGAIAQVMGALLICLCASFACAQPAEIPIPVPRDNMPNAGRAALGKILFFEKGVSVNNTISCADCHLPDHGFAEPRQVSLGRRSSDGTRPQGNRNSISLLNAAFERGKFHDGTSPDDFEDQALRPTGNPREMGPQRPQEMIARLKRMGYDPLFRAVGFPGVTIEGFAACIAQYQRTLVATDTNYNRALAGDTYYMNAAEKHGMQIFFGKAHCSQCHNGPLLNDAQRLDAERYHNIGTEYFARRGNLNGADVGRQGVTNTAADARKFRTSRLIGVGLTDPYMHNGSFATLRDCVAYFNAGGYFRRGDGRYERDPNIDPRIQPLGLTELEMRDLETFLTVSLYPRDYAEVAR